MAEPKFRHVLEVAASSAFSLPPSEEALRALRKPGVKTEEALIELLREHRLQHLFWNAVLERGAEDFLCARHALSMREDFEHSQKVHAAHEWALISVADTLSRAGLEVIACKGVVLGRDYYPKPGLRRMHDVDLWLTQPDIEACSRELEKLGYRERTEMATHEARNFVNEDGVVLDVHTKMRLFQDKGHHLTSVSRPVPGLPFRVFVPEAQVAHLLAHLLGHAPKTGILIIWILDIALVLRSHPVDPNFLRTLLRDDGSWGVFLRFLRTFLELGWLSTDFGLTTELRTARLIRWEALLRQRRLCGWGGIRGKLRLGKALLLGKPPRAPIPHATDYLWQPLDWLFEKNPLAAHSGALILPRED